MQKMKNLGSIGNSGRPSTEESEDDDISKLAISTFQAREEEIERKKMAVKEKVELQLGRAEEETRRLAQIWDELEVLTDPMRKEVAIVRKKIDMANRDLKPLGQSCQKKEKEYKEALEAFQEKNKEKSQLITTLMELLTESEKLRMKKLEELSKNIESIN
ncbi:isoform 4 of rab6-interacting golgin [Fagus crenata]